ncbi:NAD(P)H-hydrate dehydratase [Candidatus Roizmanbacteria bacterium]|nr:NAD(P)H-hydrate dehydratase [Candidatus Roizmanbacteria bacterium]
MRILTSRPQSIREIVSGLNLPAAASHKGQNGKVLIIGGSSLFHSASLWAAEVASHFVDMVHYASTAENEEIFLSLKKKFHNGMVVPQEHLFEYVAEDDAILIGPGMMRGDGKEAEYTRTITYKLLSEFPEKKFVIDAGALQMMDAEWLRELKTTPIITPHQKEFEKLFGEDIFERSAADKINQVKIYAKDYRAVTLLKAIVDIVSDGQETYVIEGGNAGMTKGGTGDLLAALTVSLYATNQPLLSAVLASYLLKRSADKLFSRKGYWYNIEDLITVLPTELKELAL